jgi:hypothetical protein
MRRAYRLCTRSTLGILLFAILLLSSTAYAQSQTGSLSGVVVDASGASIQNATVEARKSDTGLTLTTTTTQDGLFVFPAVPTGTWSVSVEKQGFRRVVQEGIEIFIAQRQTINVTLQIGDAKQTVEVTSQQSLLDLETSERGQTFSRTFLQTLPLWSGGLQSSEAFLSYMPGVNNGGEVSMRGRQGAPANR